MSRGFGEFKHFKVVQNDFSVEVEDFSFTQKELIWLRAPSGYGKTTLLRSIAGFQKAMGELWLAGERLDLKPPHERNVGVVFQDQILFSHLNAFENVLMGLRLRKQEKEGQAKVESLFSQMGLASRMHAPVQELSGGERQRVAVLRALVWKPKLLLLDEPFKGLDESARARMKSVLSQFMVESPTPMIWVSHEGDAAVEGVTLHLENDPQRRALNARKFIIR